MNKSDYIGGIVGIGFLNGDKILGKIKDFNAGSITVVSLDHNDEHTFSKTTITRLLVLVRNKRNGNYTEKTQR
jgi:hypothetical protein